MARRRSTNRRSSRKSMNFTELDNDSELINRDNPLWWKNIESDITVRQSRRISLAETTAGILNSDSLVDPSELPDAWWDKLDKTNPKALERVSSRPSNTPAYTLNDSNVSDDIDHASIKKRKVVLRTRSNKSETTDNFAKALVHSDLAQAESLSTEKRKNPSNITSDTEVVRKKKGKLQHSSARNSPEGSDKDASEKTSDDSDLIVKARPLAFKKRSTKLANDLFDDILRNEPVAGSSGISSVAKGSRSRNSTISQSTMEPLAISFSANESGRSVDNRSEILQQVSDRDDSELMQPPKAKLPHRKHSSVSHSRIVNSDDSDSDGTLKKVRPFFSKKNLQKVSMNPFHEILNQSSDNESRESNDSVKKHRTSKHSATGNPNDSNRRPDSQTSMRKNLRAEDSHGRRIDQGEDDVSLTGERSLRSTSKNRSLRSTSTKRSLRSTSKNRSLRSTSQSRMLKSTNEIPDSAYELPPRERSSPSFNRSVSWSIDRSPTQTKINELNKSKTPRRESRTMVFSDEDISVEDMSNGNESNQIFLQNMSRDDKVRRSRRSVRSKNKSLRSIQAVENNSEEEATDADPTDPKSSSSILKDKSRISRKSLAPANKSRSRIELDESLGEDEPDDVERTNPKSSSSILKDKSRISRKSLAPANKSRSRIELDESLGEDEPDDVERTNPKSSSSILKDKSRISRKSLAPANKSRSRIELDESLGEDEPDDVERTNPKSSSSISKDKSRISRKSLAPAKKSRSRIELDESLGEDEPDDVERTNPKSSSSILKDKSRISRKSLAPANKSRSRIELDESLGEDEPDDVERTNPKSSSSISKDKSRISRKSLAPANKSRSRIELDENLGEDEPDDVERTNPKSSSSIFKDKSRISRKSLAPANKSRSRIELDESIGEDEPDDVERTNPKSSSTILKDKSRISRKSLAPANKSRSRIELDESLGEDEPDDVERTNPKSSSSILKDKSRISRKSLAPANKSRSRIELDESLGEDEPDDVERTNPKSLSSILKDKSRLSTVSRTSRNKSSQTTKTVKNLSEAETDIEERADPESSTSSSNEIYNTSRKNLASTRKYLKPFKSVENLTGDETIIAEDTDPESSTSAIKDKSRTSRKSLVPTNESQGSAAYNRSNSEDESDDAENTDPKSSKSFLKEKSQTSRNSLGPANKSQPRVEADESSSEDEAKRAKSSSFPGKDHFQTSERNLTPVNKSRRRTESHEGVNESENEVDENPNRKSSSSHVGEKSGKSRKSVTPTDNVTDNAEQTTESGVSLSEAEITSTPNTNVSSNSELGEKSHISRKSIMPTIDSQPLIESGESISEQEVESSGSTNRSSLKSQLEESHVSVRSLGTTNKSREIIESNKSISENEAEVENIEKTDRDQSDSHLKKKGDTSIRSRGPANKSLQASNKIDASRISSHRLNISSALEFARSVEKENAEDAEQTNQTNEGKTNNRILQSKNSSIQRNDTKHREPSLSKERNQEKNDASLAIPMEKTPRAQQMNNPSSKKINKSSANKTNVSESQKTIMDFFPSRFLQRSEHTRVHEAPTDFDKEKLISIKKKMDKIKSREIELLENDIVKRKKTDLLIHSITATKGKLRGKKNATSKPKRAGQVDTVVYKPPKLVRPQLWATDRLYRHLWKRMEPTCQMATRRKSIKFVQQLSQIVSLTIKRKKYDNYKLQVQALMNEMARLDIIKTRNDFYDFCYDFLPYEFRVKVTPIFLPGNICSIPYNPKKLHAPILSGGED